MIWDNNYGAKWELFLFLKIKKSNIEHPFNIIIFLVVINVMHIAPVHSMICEFYGLGHLFPFYHLYLKTHRAGEE